MSYSLDSISNKATWSITAHTSALAKLQEQASTGQNVNRVSDAPYDANQILYLRTEISSSERYVDTIDEMISRLDLSSEMIQQMTGESGLSRVWTSLTSANQPATTANIRSQMSGEIDEILENIVSLANKQHLGNYLFSGATSSTPPYAVQRNGEGQITRVDYQGSYEEREVEISANVEMSSVLVGDNLFRYDDRQEPVFYGSTGTTGGTGTSSVRGDVTLTVGGVAGAWVLSIDGGTTTVTADGSETNLAVVNSATGEVLYVDATGITETGTENIRVPGTYDIFNALIHARDLLGQADSMPYNEWTELMNATIDSVGQVQANTVGAYPKIGLRLNMLTNLKDNVEDIKASNEEEIARKQDADITQVAIGLAKHEMLYQMSLLVVAKMFSLSLMNFIE